MDLGVVIVLLAVVLGVGLYLSAPLMIRRVSGAPVENREASSLMAERERVINALRELDFDFKLGKIPEEDYPNQRADLLHKGAEILKKLDALSSIVPSSESNAEALLENAVTAGRVDAPGQRLSDDEIESMLAARRKLRKTKSVGFCPNCGKPVLVSDQFCPNCGKALK